MQASELVGHYAVIFISHRQSARDDDGYNDMAGRMVELAAQQQGYLDIKSVRDADGMGITVSYWRSLEDIAAWRANSEHSLAREQGKRQWYRHFELQIAKIDRAYQFDRQFQESRP